MPAKITGYEGWFAGEGMFPFFARWRAGFEEDEKKNSHWELDWRTAGSCKFLKLHVFLIGVWMGELLEWRCSEESYVEITRVPYMMIIYSVEYCTPLTAKRTNDQLIIFRKKITIK